MNEREWITVQEAALLTQTSARTIWRLVAEHNLNTAKRPARRETLVNYFDITRALQKRHAQRAS